MATVSTTCPYCQQLVPHEAQVCPHCGAHLQDGIPTPSLPQNVHTPVPMQATADPLPPVALENTLPDALKQLDSTATTVVTISGVLIAFYAGAIFAGKVQASQWYDALVYALPILLLLVTIILAVRVFYPAGYLLDDYPTLFKEKDKRLSSCLFLLEMSVALLAFSVFIYLVR